ncbi:MAG: enoyl-CoA hydratase/isomerase family protein [Candidatus Marinimicrobia bacterium]|nr:enoyl-CoA hydratase/isomerase family protein [Candidatus Neomarinimicrobiota bacterium]
MPYKNLLYEVEERIAVVTVNRPEVMNALNRETVAELKRAALSVRDDDGIGGMIITGMGDKAFIAGADINELAKENVLSGRDTSIRGQSTLQTFELMGKPIIAAINGYALGGGFELTLGCHIRIAAENAMMGLPEVGLGIMPGFGGTQRLPRLIGTSKALEMILTGKTISAEEALGYGLLSKVVPEGKSLEAAKEMMKVILSKAPVSIKMCIEAVNRGMNMTLDEGLAIESDRFGILCGTEDMKEGMNAFLEKREPQFKGS